MGLCIDENSIKKYVSDYLDYLKVNDKDLKTVFIKKGDSKEDVEASAWYTYESASSSHVIYFNLPNLDTLLYYLLIRKIDIDQFFGIITLIVGHEYRHFEQGRCIYDGKNIEGFSLQDGFETQLILYIKYLFEVYYIRNKGYLKCEEDAELFAIKRGIEFYKMRFPKIDAKDVFLRSAIFLGSLNGELSSEYATMPTKVTSFDELVSELDRRIDAGYRHPWLPATLRATSFKQRELGESYGIDYSFLMSDEFIYGYKDLNSGYERDLFVVKKLLDSVNDPFKSLQDFNLIKEKYLQKKL